MIKEPTHILDTSSCIDLILTSHPNLIVEPGVHLSLHSSCYHEIVYAKFNLEILHLIYGTCGTIKILTLNSLDKQLMDLIGNESF